jgi:hypothetical protein
MAQIDPVDVGAFYSSPPLDVWRRILGNGMHYHHGIWEADEDWAAALNNAVLTLAQYVEPGSTVLDLGCGWGGPAALLVDRVGCDVVGVTVSHAQAAYCATRGLDVRHLDLDREMPTGHWSVGWWMESLEHLEHPEQALIRLRSRCERLVMRVNTCETAPRRRFAGSMPMLSTADYLGALERSGWRVRHLSNRRTEALRSPFEWLAGLRAAGIANPDDAHLRALWDYSVLFTTKPSLYAMFPLVDIVAE